MDTSTRTFTSSPAIRASTPLFIGIDGATGCGKTYSGLRLATGIQRVVGGEIFGVDTESNRMLHYADKFKFTHVPFSAPFSPDDYRAVIEYCVSKGAKTIILDSATHEHEGEGGVLEWHTEETHRLAQLWKCSEEKAQMAAWKAPKQARRRMIARLLQINANIIFCFRAREKLKIVPGREPVDLGYMPIGAEELFFEMTLSCLLLPMAKGVPNWESKLPGEKAMMKLPSQFESLFGQPKQLDEETGQRLAEWAAGSAPSTAMPPADVERFVEELTKCETMEALAAKFKEADEAAKKAKDAAARTKFASVKDELKGAIAGLATGAL